MVSQYDHNYGTPPPNTGPQNYSGYEPAPDRRDLTQPIWETSRQQPPAHYPRPQQYSTPMPYAYAPGVQAGASGALVAVAWVIAVFTFLYMLPWAVAVTRKKSNHGAIALLNLFLGWSFVGWVVALVMACSAESRTNVLIVNQYPGGPQQYR